MNINISARHHFLQFKSPFRIAHGVREGTNVVIVKAEYNGKMGFGEASLPPYLPATVDSTLSLINNELLSNISFPVDIQSIMDELNRRVKYEMPGKAAIEMALWNLKAACENTTFAENWNIKPTSIVTPHFFTIGIGNKAEMRQKIDDGLAFGFDHFKLKLNGENDFETIRNFKELTNSAFAVDVNQGWKSLDYAIEVAQLLEQTECLLLEQPFDKADRILSRELKDKFSIPIIADEACQLPSDVLELSDSFDGINIKLQKCGGILNALEMIRLAESKNLKILIGCMSESSIGCGIAEVLAPLCHWADLDGPYLTVDIPDPAILFID